MPRMQNGEVYHSNQNQRPSYSPQAANQRTQDLYNQLMSRNHQGLTARAGDDPTKTRELGQFGKLFAGMSRISQGIFENGRFAEAQQEIQRKKQEGEDVTLGDQLKRISGVPDLAIRGLFGSMPDSVSRLAEGVTGIPYTEADESGTHVGDYTLAPGRRLADVGYAAVEPLSTVVGAGAVAARAGAKAAGTWGKEASELGRVGKIANWWGSHNVKNGALGLLQSAGAEGVEEGLQAVAEEYRGAGSNEDGTWGWSNINPEQVGSEAFWGAMAGGFLHGAGRLAESAVDNTVQKGVEHIAKKMNIVTESDETKNLNNASERLAYMQNHGRTFTLTPYQQNAEEYAKNKGARQKNAFSAKFQASRANRNPLRNNGLLGIGDFTVSADVFATIWNVATNRQALDDSELDAEVVAGFQSLKDVMQHLDTDNSIERAVNNWNAAPTEANGAALANAVNQVLRSSPRMSCVFWKNPGAKRTGQFRATFCGIDTRGTTATSIYCNPLMSSYMNVDSDGDLASLFFDIMIDEDGQIARTGKFDNVFGLVQTLRNSGQATEGKGDEFAAYFRDTTVAANANTGPQSAEQFEEEVAEILSLVCSWGQDEIDTSGIDEKGNPVTHEYTRISEQDENEILSLYLTLLIRKNGQNSLFGDTTEDGRFVISSEGITKANELLKRCGARSDAAYTAPRGVVSYETLVAKLENAAYKNIHKAYADVQRANPNISTEDEIVESVTNIVLSRIGERFMQSSYRIFMPKETADEIAQEVESVITPGIPTNTRSWLNVNFSDEFVNQMDSEYVLPYLFELLLGAFATPNNVTSAEILRFSIAAAFKAAKTFANNTSDLDVDAILAQWFKICTPGTNPTTAITAVYYMYLMEEMLSTEQGESVQHVVAALRSQDGLDAMQFEIEDIIKAAQKAEKKVRDLFEKVIVESNYGQVIDQSLVLPASFEDDAYTALVSMFPGVKLANVTINGQHIHIPTGHESDTLKEYVESFSALRTLGTESELLAATTNAEERILNGLRQVYTIRMTRLENSARKSGGMLDVIAKNLRDAAIRINDTNLKLNPFELVVLQTWYSLIYGFLPARSVRDMWATTASVSSVLNDPMAQGTIIKNGRFNDQLTAEDLMRFMIKKMVQANFFQISYEIDMMNDLIDDQNAIRDVDRFNDIRNAIHNELLRIESLNPFYAFLARRVMEQIQENDQSPSSWLEPLGDIYNPNIDYETLCRILSQSDLDLTTETDSDEQEGIIPLFAFAMESIFETGDVFSAGTRFKDMQKKIEHAEISFPIGHALSEIASLQTLIDHNPNLDLFTAGRDHVRVTRGKVNSKAFALQIASKFIISNADKDKGVNDIGSSLSYIEQNIIRTGKLNGVVDSTSIGAGIHDIYEIFTNPVFLREFLFESDNDRFLTQYMYFRAQDGTVVQCNALDLWNILSQSNLTSVTDINSQVVLKAFENVPQLALLAGDLTFTATGSEGALSYSMGYSSKDTLSSWINQDDRLKFYTSKQDSLKSRVKDKAEACCDEMFAAVLDSVDLRALVATVALDIFDDSGRPILAPEKIQKEIEHQSSKIAHFFIKYHMSSPDSEFRQQAISSFKRKACSSILNNAFGAALSSSAFSIKSDFEKDRASGTLGNQSVNREHVATILQDIGVDVASMGSQNVADFFIDAFNRLYDSQFGHSYLDEFSDLFSDARLSYLSPAQQDFLAGVLYLAQTEGFEVLSANGFFEQDSAMRSYYDGLKEIVLQTFDIVFNNENSGLTAEEVESLKAHVAFTLDQEVDQRTLSNLTRESLKDEAQRIIHTINMGTAQRFISKDDIRRGQTVDEQLAIIDRFLEDNAIIGAFYDLEKIRKDGMNIDDIVFAINRAVLDQMASDANVLSYDLFDSGSFSVYHQILGILENFDELATKESLFAEWDDMWADDLNSNIADLAGLVRASGEDAITAGQLFDNMDIGNPNRDLLFSRIVNGSAASSVEPQVADACAKLRTTGAVGWLQDETDLQQYTNDSCDIDTAILRLQHGEFINGQEYGICRVVVSSQSTQGGRYTKKRMISELSLAALEQIKEQEITAKGAAAQGDRIDVYFYENGPWCLYAGDLAFQSSPFDLRPTKEVRVGGLVGKIKNIVKKMNFIPSEPLALKFKKNPGLRRRLSEAIGAIQSVSSTLPTQAELSAWKAEAGGKASRYCDLQEGSVSESLFYFMIHARENIKKDLRSNINSSPAVRKAFEDDLDETDYQTLTNFLTPVIDVEFDDGSTDIVPIYNLRQANSADYENDGALYINPKTKQARTITRISMRMHGMEEITSRCVMYTARELQKAQKEQGDEFHQGKRTRLTEKSFTEAYKYGYGYRYFDAGTVDTAQDERAGQILSEFQRAPWSAAASGDFLILGYSPTAVQQIAGLPRIQKRPSTRNNKDLKAKINPTKYRAHIRDKMYKGLSRDTKDTLSTSYGIRTDTDTAFMEFLAPRVNFGPFANLMQEALLDGGSEQTIIVGGYAENQTIQRDIFGYLDDRDYSHAQGPGTARMFMMETQADLDLSLGRRVFNASDLRDRLKQESQKALDNGNILLTINLATDLYQQLEQDGWIPCTIDPSSLDDIIGQPSNSLYQAWIHQDWLDYTRQPVGYTVKRDMPADDSIKIAQYIEVSGDGSAYFNSDEAWHSPQYFKTSIATPGTDKNVLNTFGHSRIRMSQIEAMPTGLTWLSPGSHTEEEYANWFVEHNIIMPDNVDGKRYTADFYYQKLKSTVDQCTSRGANATVRTGDLYSGDMLTMVSLSNGAVSFYYPIYAADSFSGIACQLDGDVVVNTLEQGGGVKYSLRPVDTNLANGGSRIKIMDPYTANKAEADGASSRSGLFMRIGKSDGWFASYSGDKDSSLGKIFTGRQYGILSARLLLGLVYSNRHHLTRLNLFVDENGRNKTALPDSDAYMLAQGNMSSPEAVQLCRDIANGKRPIFTVESVRDLFDNSSYNASSAGINAENQQRTVDDLNRAVAAVFRIALDNGHNPIDMVCSHLLDENGVLSTDFKTSNAQMTPEAFRTLSPSQVVALFAVMDTTPFEVLDARNGATTIPGTNNKTRLCPISFSGFKRTMQESGDNNSALDTGYYVCYDDLTSPIPMVQSYTADRQQMLWVPTVAFWDHYISDDNAVSQSISGSASYGIKQSEFQALASYLTPAQIDRLTAYADVYAGDLGWFNTVYEEDYQKSVDNAILLAKQDAALQQGRVVPKRQAPRDMFGVRMVTDSQKERARGAIRDGLNAMNRARAMKRYIQFDEAMFSDLTEKEKKKLEANKWRVSAAEILKNQRDYPKMYAELQKLINSFREAIPGQHAQSVNEYEVCSWMMLFVNNLSQYTYESVAASDNDSHYIQLKELQDGVSLVKQNFKDNNYPLQSPLLPISFIEGGTTDKRAFGFLHREAIDQFCNIFQLDDDVRNHMYEESVKNLHLMPKRLELIDDRRPVWTTINNVTNYVGLSFDNIDSQEEGIRTVADEYRIENQDPWTTPQDHRTAQTYRSTLLREAPYLDIDEQELEAMEKRAAENQRKSKIFQHYKDQQKVHKTIFPGHAYSTDDSSNDLASRILNSTVVLSLMARIATPGVLMGARVEPLMFGNLILANMEAGMRGVGAYAIPANIRESGGMMSSSDFKSVLTDRQDVLTVFSQLRELSLHGAIDKLIIAVDNGRSLTDAIQELRAADKNLQKFGNDVFAWLSGSKFGDQLQARIFFENLQFELATNPEFRHMFDVDPTTNMSEWQARMASKDLASNMLQLFASNSAFADIALRSLNTAYQATAMQSTLTSVVMGEICKKYPAFQVIQKTMLAPFLQYQVAIADRMLNTFLPMATISYLALQMDIPIIPLGKITDQKTGEKRWTQLSDIDVQRRAAVAGSLKQAILMDVSRIGVAGVVALIIALGAIEPPDDDDKRGNIDEWTLFGFRIKNEWWISDLIGPIVAIAAAMYGFAEGKPNFDVLWNAMGTWLYNNPLTDVDDIINIMTDPLGYANDAYLEELDLYTSNAGEADPTQQEVLAASLLAGTLNWSTGLLCPSILKELYRNSQELEKSYKKVYKLDANGNVITDSNGNPVFEYASYQDQKIRKVTRSNPWAAAVMNMITGDTNQVGYKAAQMPPTVYYDPASLNSLRTLSLHNEDGTEKTDAECQQIALYVISTLLSSKDMKALYDSGFCIPYETIDYVGDVVWDIAFNGSETIQQFIADYGITSDSEYADINELYESLVSMQENNYNFWKNFYYDKLNSDEMKQGVARYNRYATYYEQDANGEWYASGYRRNRGAIIPIPFIQAPGTLDNPGSTMGYENDWATRSVVTGESTGMRALIPADDWNFKTRTFETRASDGNGTSYSNAYNKYSLAYDNGSGGSGRGRGGGYGGGGGGGSRGGYVQTPNIYMPNPERAGMLNTNFRPSSASLDYLRPSFETKGSREAYKREDIQ